MFIDKQSATDFSVVEFVGCAPRRSWAENLQFNLLSVGWDGTLSLLVMAEHEEEDGAPRYDGPTLRTSALTPEAREEIRRRANLKAVEEWLKRDGKDEASYFEEVAVVLQSVLTVERRGNRVLFIIKVMKKYEVVAECRYYQVRSWLR